MTKREGNVAQGITLSCQSFISRFQNSGGRTDDEGESLGKEETKRDTQKKKREEEEEVET